MIVLIYCVFRPSLELQVNETSRELLDKNTVLTKKLLKAERLGRSHGNCDGKYSKCIISIVDLMTVLYVI